MKSTIALPQKEFRRREAAGFGLDARTLDELLRRGELEKIARGLYRPTGLPSADLDLLEIALKAPSATLCLSSALARHELIDEIPSRIDIALPRGQRTPATSAPIEWHQFDKATFGLGRSTTPIDGTNQTIGLFSPERSIVDAFRMRRTIGYETPNEALKAWLRRPGSQPAALLSIAKRIPRSMGPLRQALEILT